MKLFKQLGRSFSLQSSSRTKPNWHCIIGFLINAALLNVYFILHATLLFNFSREIHFFERLYFSEYNIWMSLCFLVEKRASIKYLRNCWEWEGHPNAYSYVQGEGVSCLMCTYALSLSLSIFLAAFLSKSLLFFCRNLTSSLFKKDLLIRNGHFSLTRSVVMKKGFFTWSYFCEPKFAKMLLILIT